jgi:transcriptional antiterminator RfaH
VDDLLQAERRWWGVYTRSRQEKSLARDLLAQRIPFFLPLVPQTLVYRRSRVISHLPLFSGYVFLCGTEEERVSCLKTNRVSRLIEVSDQAQLVRDLRQLQRAIASGAPLSVESRLMPGQRVRVCHGPLVDLEGVIVRRQRPTRLIVSVDLLRQGVSLEIDDCLVRPI